MRQGPIGEGNARFSVKFYLVAMLFILFDIEVVFMYPWAVVYRQMLADHATRNLILASMVSFLLILFAGYLYALKKKAFDWKSDLDLKPQSHRGAEANKTLCLGASVADFVWT